MKITHLVVVTGGYPSPAAPTHTPFVKQFAHAVARQGVRCTVVHPVAAHDGVNRKGYPFRTVEPAGDGASVEILRPLFLSLSARASFARFGRLNPGIVTLANFTAAVRRTLKARNLHPDALYGHFLYLAGVAAIKVGNMMRIPAFPGVGEGEFWTVRNFGKARLQQDICHASAFTANSTVLKKMLHSELAIPPSKIGVFPNGIDNTIFHPRDKAQLRQQYGLPQNLFLTVYAGNYLFKKGAVRVAEAIGGLAGVGGIFMGQGPMPPKGDNIVFNARVPHAQVPELLCAADVFVLPTLVEGSSNAIVEAMACGLPVVSSTGAFNDDLLSPDMSIRVDPMNVQAIRDAILTLRDNPGFRARMAEAALKQSRRFDINERARRILDFMTEKIAHVDQ